MDVSSPIIVHAYRALIAHQVWITIYFPKICPSAVPKVDEKPRGVLVAKQDLEKLHALIEGHPESRRDIPGHLSLVVQDT